MSKPVLVHQAGLLQTDRGVRLTDRPAQVRLRSGLPGDQAVPDRRGAPHREPGQVRTQPVGHLGRGVKENQAGVGGSAHRQTRVRSKAVSTPGE